MPLCLFHYSFHLEKKYCTQLNFFPLSSAYSWWYLNFSQRFWCLFQATNYILYGVGFVIRYPENGEEPCPSILTDMEQIVCTVNAAGECCAFIIIASLLLAASQLCVTTVLATDSTGTSTQLFSEFNAIWTLTLRAVLGNIASNNTDIIHVTECVACDYLFVSQLLSVHTCSSWANSGITRNVLQPWRFLDLRMSPKMWSPMYTMSFPLAPSRSHTMSEEPKRERH